MADPRELSQEEKVRMLERIRTGLGTSRQGLDGGSADAGPQEYHDGRWAFGGAGGGGRFNWNGGYTTEYPPIEPPDAGSPDAGSGGPKWRDPPDPPGNKLMGPSEGGGTDEMDPEKMEAKKRALEAFRDYAKGMRADALKKRVSPRDSALADKVMGASGTPDTGKDEGDLADRVMGATMAGVPRSELDPDDLPDAGRVDDQTEGAGADGAGTPDVLDAGASSTKLTVGMPEIDKRTGKTPTVDIGTVKVRRSPGTEIDGATRAELKRLMDKIEAEKGPVDKLRDLFGPVREALGIDSPSGPTAPARSRVDQGPDAGLSAQDIEDLGRAAEDDKD